MRLRVGAGGPDLSAPGGDLGARAETQLVEDATHVTVHSVLRDEQPSTDLLVAQALGDQPRDLALALAERRGGRVGRRRSGLGWLAQRQPDRGGAAQAAARVVLELERRTTERGSGRLMGVGDERDEVRDRRRAHAALYGLRRPDQPSR